MSQEDFSAGFDKLQNLQQRDEQHLASTAHAVHHHSRLFNAVVNRLNNLEAVVNLITDSVNSMGDEIKDAFNQVEKLGVDWDNKLRRDSDDMAARLEEKHTETRALVDQAASGRPASEHASAGRWRVVADAQMQVLGRNISEAAGRPQEFAATVDVTEANARFMAFTIQEMQGQISKQASVVEVLGSQIFVLEQTVSSSGPSPAPAPSAGAFSSDGFERASDPMAKHEKRHRSARPPRSRCDEHPFWSSEGRADSHATARRSFGAY